MRIHGLQTTPELGLQGSGSLVVGKSKNTKEKEFSLKDQLSSKSVLKALYKWKNLYVCMM